MKGNSTTLSSRAVVGRERGSLGRKRSVPRLRSSCTACSGMTMLIERGFSRRGFSRRLWLWPRLIPDFCFVFQRVEVHHRLKTRGRNACRRSRRQSSFVAIDPCRPNLGPSASACGRREVCTGSRARATARSSSGMRLSQVGFVVALGRGVHHADEFCSRRLASRRAAMSGCSGLNAERGLERALIVGEVIHASAARWAGRS